MTTRVDASAGITPPVHTRRVLVALVAMILAGPLLLSVCRLMDVVRSTSPDWLVTGSWAIPAVLLAGIAVSWRLFRTTLPGIIGWLLGLVLLPVARLMDGAIADAGLCTAMVIQGPVVITLVLFLRARTRRLGQTCTPMGVAWGVMLIWAIVLGLFAVRGFWQWGALGLGVAMVSAVAAALARAILPRPGRLPADVPTVLNTVFGYSTFVICCVTLPLLAPPALLLAVMRPALRARLFAAAMRRGMTTVLFNAPTVAWRFDGDLKALDDARVVVANHEGMLDILAVCSMPGTRTLLAKTWVFKAFPLGLAARAAGLRNSDALEEEDYRDHAALTANVHEGAGILVFPEGRRSRTGGVHRFRPGAFVLAASLGAPVVPLAIAGSRQGIRPDGMWIHPTILHCRALPPMRPLPEESHRQFAERCRLAIATARNNLMREHVADPRMVANRLHHFTGLGGAMARAIRAEHAAGAWRLLAAVCGDADEPWLFIGCGWSTMPVTVRQLLPTPAFIAIDRDAGHRAVASSSWFHPEQDRLLDAVAVASLPERLGGVVCWLPWQDALVQELGPVALARLHGPLLVPDADGPHWRSLGADDAGPVHSPGDPDRAGSSSGMLVLRSGLRS